MSEERELHNVIFQLNSNKNCGFDSIIASFVKIAADVISLILAVLISLMQWFPTFFSSLPTFDVTDPQLPTTKLQYYRSLPQLYQSVRCKKKGLYVENIGEEKKKICTSAGSGAPKIWQKGGALPGI